MGKVIQSINNSGDNSEVKLAEDDQLYKIDPKASVSINGKSACLTDLKAGDEVTLSGRPATHVEAIRCEEKDGPAKERWKKDGENNPNRPAQQQLYHPASGEMASQPKAGDQKAGDPKKDGPQKDDKGSSLPQAK